MKTAVKLLAAALLSVSLFFAVTYSCVEIVTYDKSFYSAQFEKHGVSQDTGIETDELKKIAEQIRLFLNGQREDFNIYAVKDGVYQPLFGSQEEFHMNEVRQLYSDFAAVRNVCLAFIAFIFIVSLLKKSAAGFALLSKSAAIIIAFMTITGIGVALFFDPLFTAFHKVFFRNNMWLFPASSLLIRILPQGLFISAAVRIVVYSISAYIALIILCGFIKKALNRKSGGHA